MIDTGVSDGSRDMVDNFGGTGFTSDLGDGVNSGGAGNLGDGVASLDRGDYLLDDGDIDAMFSNNLSAGSLNALGDGLRDGISNRGRGNNGGGNSMSIRGNTVNGGKTSIESFGISFGFSFGSTLVERVGSELGALFVDDFLASLFIGDFFADNIFSFADGGSRRST